MVVNKIHDSMEEPPDIPIITGQAPGSKKRRVSSSDAVLDALIAATAVSKFLFNSTP